jgi:hypothetical protein
MAVKKTKTEWNLGGSHYTYCSQDPHQRAISATKMLQAVNKFMKGHPDKIPLLVYTGMSGTSIATTLSIKLFEAGVVHHMMYVRKKEEISHGNQIEENLPWGQMERAAALEKCVAIFIDDQICSGTTFHRCRNKIWSLYHVPLDYFLMERAWGYPNPAIAVKNRRTVPNLCEDNKEAA